MNKNSQKSFLVFASIHSDGSQFLLLLAQDLSVMLYTHFLKTILIVLLLFLENMSYYAVWKCHIYILNLICLLLNIQSDTYQLSSHLFKKFQISQTSFHIQQAFSFTKDIFDATMQYKKFLLVSASFWITNQELF